MLADARSLPPGLSARLERFAADGGGVWLVPALGGVPRTLLYDNLKSVVLERSGEHIRFHPRLLELAGHYHFAPQPCAVARGNEKGRVERMIQYLRHAFFAARRFTSVEALEPTADAAARPRPSPAQTPRDQSGPRNGAGS